jgi:hypothetical protein
MSTARVYRCACCQHKQESQQLKLAAMAQAYASARLAAVLAHFVKLPPPALLS